MAGHGPERAHRAAALAQAARQRTRQRRLISASHREGEILEGHGRDVADRGLGLSQSHARL